VLEFFSIAWDKENERSNIAARNYILKAKSQMAASTPFNSSIGWADGFAADGAAVFFRSSGQFHKLPIGESSGCILGTLYRKGPDGDLVNRVEKLSENECDQIVSSNLQILSERYWGTYIGFTMNKGTFCVARDPTGAQLCFSTWHRGLFFTFSQLAVLPIIDELSLSYSESGILQNLLNGWTEPPTTGIEGFKELPPGHTLNATPRLRNESERETCIRSWRVEELSSKPINDPLQAKHLIRSVTMACIGSRAQSYERIVLQHSGGLDSSILLACLAECGVADRVNAIHLRSEAGDYPEQQYAELVSRQHEIPLEVRYIKPRQLEDIYGEISVAIPSPKPQLADSALYADVIEFASTIKAQAVFTGLGGDQVFLKNVNEAILQDYITERGVDFGFFEHLQNLSYPTQKSVWHLVRCLATGETTKKTIDRFKQFDVLNKKIQDDTSMYASAIASEQGWERALETRPAKKQHLRLVNSLDFYSDMFGYGGKFDSVNPFISQPIMEIIARIPTYLLAYKGRSRGLAREAFKSILPYEVYSRLDKGFVKSYVGLSYVNSLNYVRDFLLDGVLIGTDLLDAEKLESLLNVDKLRIAPMFATMTRLLTTESWMRSIETVRNNHGHQI